MICDVCQRPLGDDEPTERTVAGEPAHDDCLERATITPGDVEGVREELLEGIPEDASDEFRTAWIDATIAFDRRLTDPRGRT